MATLRSALEGQGLTVERLHVSSSALHQQQSSPDAQQQAHTDAGEGQSRGRGDGQANQRRDGDTNALFDAIFDELHHGQGTASSQRLAGAAT